MSYNYLVNATKNRIITELRDVFAKHPHYKDLEIVNKFPYEERLQEGIVVRNSSAARVPLSADNFQGTVKSYVTVAKHLHSPSLSVQWVREDRSHLAQKVIREDYSHLFSNLPQHNRTITLTNQMVRSSLDLTPTNDKRAIEIYINGQKVLPSLVDGERREIILSEPPPTNSTVEVSYWSRNLAPPGVYQLEITGGDPQTYHFEFTLDALLEKEEVVFESASGNETTAILKNKPVYKGSLKLRENGNLLNENEDYVIDYENGIVTFLQTPAVLTGSKIEAKYRVKGLSTGPFQINGPNQAVNTALPGVVIAFGKGVSIGDKHFIIVNKERDIVAQEYSGKWDMNISLEIYAKDSHKIEEVIDITTSSLLFTKKEQLDEEGVALVDVSFGGESEQLFDEATGDLYYMGSVDYQFLTEWILHKPLLKAIEGFDVEIDEVPPQVIDEFIIIDKSFDRIK